MLHSGDPFSRLGASYLCPYWAAFTTNTSGWHKRQGQPAGRFDSTKASFVLGLTLALMSPWNIVFWLAAIDRLDLRGRAPRRC